MSSPRRVVSVTHDAEAEQRSWEALQIYREPLPERHEKIATAEGQLGGAILSLGRAEEAEPLLLRSNEVLEAEGERDEDLRLVLDNLVELYAKTKRPEKAAKYRALRRGGAKAKR